MRVSAHDGDTASGTVPALEIDDECSTEHPARALALATILLLSAGHEAARAQASDPCTVPARGPHAQRVHDEAALGMDSFKQFIKRTHGVYQLDLQTEVAKLDAERAGAKACEQAIAAGRSGTPIALEKDRLPAR